MDFAFVVRGDNLEPRYAKQDKLYTLVASKNSRIVSDASAIGGYSMSHLADDNVSATSAGVIYSGRKNTGSQKERTVFVRFKLTTESQYFVAYSSRTSGSANNQLFEILLGQNSGQGTVRLMISAAYGWSVKDQTFNIPTVIDQWHDLVVSYTGDTSANGIKIYLDGVLRAQTTGSYAQDNPYDPECAVMISLAYGFMWSQSQHYIGEVGSVDGVYTPDDFLLEDDTYGLNGSTRTSYVKCDDFNGSTWPLARDVYETAPSYFSYGEEYVPGAAVPTVSTNPGVENVLVGIDYTIEDEEFTGELKPFSGFSTLRKFLNFILTQVGQTSLTDDEWSLIDDLENPTQDYTTGTYLALEKIIIEREDSTNAKTRLKYLFLARGAEVPDATLDVKSNILIGGVIED